MQGVAFSIRQPDVRSIRRDWQAIEKEQHRAALEVTDLSSKKAQRHVQAKMRAAGLGRLANAVGQTSALAKRQMTGRTPYGVIFARGGDESRAGGALDSYSRGAMIVPGGGKRWLAFPTDAAPRFVSMGGRRRRLTPALWEQSGLNASVGKLIFRLVKPNLALLVVKRVSLHPKTGRAKMLGQRRPRTRVVPERDVAVFVLIPYTRKAQLFDQHEIMQYYANRNADYLRRVLEGYNRNAT